VEEKNGKKFCKNKKESSIKEENNKRFYIKKSKQ
tara:strand:- start:354 stop:455 length:102 start_codon:yes stop_codon:yes gene_type:complete